MRRLAALLSLVCALAVVVPTAAFAGGGGGCHRGRQEVTGTTVDIADFCFTQTVVHVAAGQSVTWTNRDKVQHAVTGVGGEWRDYEPIHPGQTVNGRFDRVGVYPYFCYLHPGMVGAVVVDSSTNAQATAARASSSHGAGSSVLAWWLGGVVAVMVVVLSTTSLVFLRRPTTA